MQVGMIGLGRMGAGMAANLLRGGHQVVVYNRTPAKAEALITGCQGGCRCLRRLPWRRGRHHVGQ